MDLGLFTGWAAGGPAAPADTPARLGESAAPAAVDANALVSAFGGLFDALTGTSADPTDADAAPPAFAIDIDQELPKAAICKMPETLPTLQAPARFEAQETLEAFEAPEASEAPAATQAFERIRVDDDEADVLERIDLIDPSATNVTLPLPAADPQAAHVTAALARATESKDITEDTESAESARATRATDNAEATEAAEATDKSSVKKKSEASKQIDGEPRVLRPGAPQEETPQQIESVLRRKGAIRALPSNESGDRHPASDPHTSGHQAKPLPDGSILESPYESSQQTPPAGTMTRTQFQVAAESAAIQTVVRNFKTAAAADDAPPPKKSVEGRSASVTPPVLVLLPPQTVLNSASAATVDLPESSPVPREVTPQIVQAIRLAWTRVSGEAHIKLDPRQFGDVSVTLRVVDGGVVARVQADEPAVREWLQTNQRVLQGALAERQLTLQRLEIARSDDRRDDTHREERDRDELPQQPRPRRARGRDNQNTFEVVA